MADISIIQLSDNTQYNIKDAKASGNLANEFSTTSTYAVGDLVIYQGDLYQCTTAITTAGAWDSSKWTQIKIANVIGGVDIVTTLDNTVTNSQVPRSKMRL